MKKMSREDFMAGCIFGGCIVGMVLTFFIAMGDSVAKPAVHTASYAVLQSSPFEYPVTTPDQEHATLVSLNGLAPGHLLSEVTR